VNLAGSAWGGAVPAISPAGDETGGEGSNGFRRFRFELTQATAKRIRGARKAGDAVKNKRHRDRGSRFRGGVL